MGEPDTLTPQALSDIRTSAALMVDAIRDDEPNPAWSPFDEMLDEATRQGAGVVVLDVLHNARVSLVRNLDMFAIAILAQEAELVAVRRVAHERQHRIVELEQTIRDLRDPPGSHECHLPDPPRHPGAFDAMKGATRRTVAGEILPPAQRATPWQKPIPGVDE